MEGVVGALIRVGKAGATGASKMRTAKCGPFMPIVISATEGRVGGANFAEVSAFETLTF